jgi:hypothetical protein
MEDEEMELIGKSVVCALWIGGLVKVGGRSVDSALLDG